MNQNYSDFFDKLRKTLEADKFNDAEFGSLDKSEFWEQLLEYMNIDRSSSSGIEQKHSPLLDGEVKGISLTTLFDYINKTSDLDSTEIDSENIYTIRLFNYIKSQLDAGNYDQNSDSGFSNSQKSLWNESINKIIVCYLENILPRSTSFIPTEGPGVFLHHDIAKADAGWDYKDGKYTEWVKPFNNIDYDGTAPDFYRGTYSYVRGDDAIQSVLSDISESQFTRDPQNAPGISDGESNRWIRLIMPKYTRNVEVEDLNRNFWVISQTLTAICAYLFWENSPILDTMKKILSELTQLWENILFLWATAAILNQKPVTEKTHTEIIYLSNNEFQDYFKFDDFNQISSSEDEDEEQIWDIIEQRLDYMKNKYSDSNLCIMPIIRDINYKHNYYKVEYYPGLYLYLKDEDVSGHVNFKYIGNHPYLKNTDPNKNGIRIDSTKLGGRAWAIHEDELIYRVYSFFEDDPPTAESYYSLIRPSFELNSASFTLPDENREGTLTFGLNIQILDVARELYEHRDQQNPDPGVNPIMAIVGTGTGSSSQVSNITWQYQIRDGKIKGILSNLNDNVLNDIITFRDKDDDIPYSGISQPVEFEINKGFYLGELISNLKRGANIDWEIVEIYKSPIRVYKEIDTDSLNALVSKYQLTGGIFDTGSSRYSEFTDFQNAYLNGYQFIQNIDCIKNKLNLTDLTNVWLERVYEDELGLESSFRNWISGINSVPTSGDYSTYFPGVGATNLDLKLIGNAIILFMLVMKCETGKEIELDYSNNSKSWIFNPNSLGTAEPINSYDKKFAETILNGITSNKIQFLTLERSTSNNINDIDVIFSEYKESSHQDITSSNKNIIANIQIPGRISENEEKSYNGVYIKIGQDIQKFPLYSFYHLPEVSVDNYPALTFNPNVSGETYTDNNYWNLCFEQKNNSINYGSQIFLMKEQGRALDYNNWLIVFIQWDEIAYVPEKDENDDWIAAFVYRNNSSLTKADMDSYINDNLTTDLEKQKYWDKYSIHYTDLYDSFEQGSPILQYLDKENINLMTSQDEIKYQSIYPSIEFIENGQTVRHYLLSSSTLTRQISVSVFRSDGEWAQTVYSRDFSDLNNDLSSAPIGDSFKWNPVSNKNKAGTNNPNKIFELRNGYEFVNISSNEKSREIYKSNGQEMAGDGITFPYDDDYSNLISYYEDWNWTGDYGDASEVNP